MYPTFNLSDFNGRVWLTADLHLGHQRVLEFTERPWTNIDKHDNALIKTACNMVGPKDLYIVNGDLALANQDNHNKIRRFIERLPGIKVLVIGSHDRLTARWYVQNGFIIAATSLILPGGVLVSHDLADATAWPKDKPVLCGHVHELFRNLDNVVNVGVDVWQYRPVLLEDALKLCTNGRADYDWVGLSKKRHKIGKRTLESEWAQTREC